MPRGSSTTSIPAGNAVFDDTEPKLDDEQLDELFAGLPQAQQEIKLDRIANDSPTAPIPGNMIEAPAGMVVLRNVKYPNQAFCIPVTDQRGVKVFGQDTVLQFFNGDLICSELQADFIQSRAPWVYREPTPPFVTEPLVHMQSNFTTRITAAYNEHVSRWADNQ